MKDFRGRDGPVKGSTLCGNMFDKKKRTQKRKEVLSTISDDSGCVIEMTDANIKQDGKEVATKIDIPYVPVHLRRSNQSLDRELSLPLPRLVENQTAPVKTLRVHFEYLAHAPFDPLRRPNWWIGDDDTSDSGSIKSEPDDVIGTKRPSFRRPFSTPDTFYSDKINLLSIDSDCDKIPGTR